MGKGSHTWFRNRVVTFFNDHDQVSKGERKARFCADAGATDALTGALALNLTTLGIPCLYYGTEQAFDGHGSGDFADRYIRESMFGGPFGAFATRGVHFFDETGAIYQTVSQILELRRKLPALRRGRQYLREISGDGAGFGVPVRMGDAIHSIIPWSRILSDQEVLLAINTDPAMPRTAWATIDAGLHRAGERLTCGYSTDPVQVGATVPVEARNGLSVRLTVPPGGFTVFA